jgi:hypothetical protein
MRRQDREEDVHMTGCRNSVLALLLALPATLPMAAPATAATEMFAGVLSGSSEAPPNASPGTGEVLVTYDDSTGLMTLSVGFAGLTGATTMAHIHCCTSGPGVNAGVATMPPSFPFFPTGVTSGVYANSFDMADPASYHPTFLAANGNSTAQARDALLGAMAEGRAYFNIHTTLFPGGEIRADLRDDRIFGNGFE